MSSDSPGGISHDGTPNERTPFLVDEERISTSNQSSHPKVPVQLVTFVTLAVLMRYMAATCSAAFTVQYARYLVCGAHYARLGPPPPPVDPTQCFVPAVEKTMVGYLQLWGLTTTILGTAVLPLWCRIMHKLTPKWTTILSTAAWIFHTPFLLLILPLAPPVVDTYGWISPIVSVHLLTLSFFISGLFGAGLAAHTSLRSLLVDASTPETLTPLLNRYQSATFVARTIAPFASVALVAWINQQNNTNYEPEPLIDIRALKAPFVLSACLAMLAVIVLVLTPQTRRHSAPTASAASATPSSPGRRLKDIAKALTASLQALAPTRSAQSWDFTVARLAVTILVWTVAEDCIGLFKEYMFYGFRLSATQVTVTDVVQAIIALLVLEAGIPALLVALNKLWSVNQPLQAETSETHLILNPEDGHVLLPAPNATLDAPLNLNVSLDRSIEPSHQEVDSQREGLDRVSSHNVDKAQHVQAQTQLRALSLAMARLQVLMECATAAVLAYGANSSFLMVALGGYLGSSVGAGVTASLESAAIVHLRLNNASSSATDDFISSMSFLTCLGSAFGLYWSNDLYARFLVSAPGMPYAFASVLLLVAVMATPTMHLS